MTEGVRVRVRAMLWHITKVIVTVFLNEMYESTHRKRFLKVFCYYLQSATCNFHRANNTSCVEIVCRDLSNCNRSFHGQGDDRQYSQSFQTCIIYQKNIKMTKSGRFFELFYIVAKIFFVHLSQIFC